MDSALEQKCEEAFIALQEACAAIGADESPAEVVNAIPAEELRDYLVVWANVYWAAQRLVRQVASARMN